MRLMDEPSPVWGVIDHLLLFDGCMTIVRKEYPLNYPRDKEFPPSKYPMEPPLREGFPRLFRMAENGNHKQIGDELSVM